MHGTLPRILSVDDDSANQRIMLDLLDELYAVDFAECGETCLERLRSSHPDLILLDIMMPGIDGYAVCAQIKADAATSDIPVVFVSGKDSLEDRIKGYEAGADDYFVKPFDHDELLIKIARLLQQRAERAQLAAHASEASSIAMRTMREVGELGVILRFYEASFAAHDEPTLATCLFEAADAFGWECSVQVRGPFATLDMSGMGVMSPLEQSLLTRAIQRGRFVDFKQRTIVNFDHVSLLIRNMPIDDEIRYGMVRDHVCLLLNGVEARIRSLETEAERDRQQQQLRTTIDTTSHVMDSLRTGYHRMRVEGATIVEDMADEINNLVLGLALTEKQERGLLAVADKGVQRTTDLFNRGIGIDEHFAKIAAQLGAASHC